MKCKLPALLALSIVCASQAAADQFNQFLSFGDSTLDSGWWSGALQGQCDGAPSPCTTGSTFKNTVIGNAIALGGGVVGAPVGVGQMNTQVLAGFFNLTALPVNQPGGTNFAIAGATDAATVTNGNIGNLNPNGTLPSTVQQITNYLNSQQNHLANPQALYVIGSGGNDVTFARDNITTGLADQHAYLTAQANALAAAIINLQSKGAQHIIVNGLPNSGGNPMKSCGVLHKRPFHGFVRYRSYPCRRRGVHSKRRSASPAIWVHSGDRSPRGGRYGYRLSLRMDTP